MKKLDDDFELKVVSSEKKGGWWVVSFDSYLSRTAMLVILFFLESAVVFYFTYIRFRLFKQNVLVTKLCCG